MVRLGLVAAGLLVGCSGILEAMREDRVVEPAALPEPPPEPPPAIPIRDASFAGWDLPGALLANAARDGWAPRSACTAQEMGDDRRFHFCTLARPGQLAEVTVAVADGDDARAYSERVSQEDGEAIARDGMTSLSVRVWSEAAAAALRDALVPPGAVIGPEGADAWTARMQALGWHRHDCAIDQDAGRERIRCTYTRTTLEAHLAVSRWFEPSRSSQPESRTIEPYDAEAVVEQPGASVTVRATDPTLGPALLAVLLESGGAGR
jgi:hypothetical protein